MRSRHRYIRFRDSLCVICGSSDALECHHLVPQRKGGRDSFLNVITLCRPCHNKIEAYEDLRLMRLGKDHRIRDLK